MTGFDKLLLLATFEINASVCMYLTAHTTRRRRRRLFIPTPFAMNVYRTLYMCIE